jgi:hypothetical protein
MSALGRAFRRLKRVINPIDREVFESTSTKVVRENGEVTVLRVNGKDIDPESPEGKKALAAFDESMAEMSKSLDSMSRSLDRMFDKD